MRIFRDSVPDKEYPVGKIFQLIPFGAMVKHPCGKFPTMKGWEFLDLEVSKKGTKIKERGEQVIKHSRIYALHAPVLRSPFLLRPQRSHEEIERSFLCMGIV
ncbi:MAG: hypothetical protein H8K03_19990 [Nitrospira sp.]